ncbi:Mu transposase C-terminal domain-containing protein [Pseudomonas fluorescens]|uniref:Mu transposase C-terminal domain-containing protein n=1 Tax=Pseudomonas fluorescens TaxID=294 RepID=UPI00381099C6
MINDKAVVLDDELWTIEAVDSVSHKLVIKAMKSKEIRVVPSDQVKYIPIKALTELSVQRAEETAAIFSSFLGVEVSQKRSKQAQMRFEAITRELNDENYSPQQAADDCKLSLARYYSIRTDYNPDIGPVSLLGKSRGRKKGETQICQKVESLIEKHRKEYTGNRRAYWKLIVALCPGSNSPPPSYETICDRIEKWDEKTKDKQTFTAEHANSNYALRDGSRILFGTHAQYQIDHAIADVFICIEGKRDSPAGRPWITLVVDASSRVIVGFDIGFRYPSLGSVARAMSHAVLSKDEFMKRLGLLGVYDYEFYGTCAEVLSDKAKEFKSPNYKNACRDENMDPVLRKQKQDGGICERLLGTLNISYIQVLPGGTKSAPVKNRDYDPAKHKVLTLEEFILYFTIAVCQYHDTAGEDGKTPRQRWHEGMVDANGNPTVSKPIYDLEKFKVGILPEKYPKIGRDGFTVNGIRYSSPLLKDMVGKHIRVKFDTYNITCVKIYLYNRWYDARAIEQVPLTLAEYHLLKAYGQRPGTMGEQGVKALLHKRALVEDAKRKSREAAKASITAQNEAANPLITHIPPAPPILRSGEELRDFSQSVDPYDGEC